MRSFCDTITYAAEVDEHRGVFSTVLAASQRLLIGVVSFNLMVNYMERTVAQVNTTASVRRALAEQKPHAYSVMEESVEIYCDLSKYRRL